MLGSGDSMIGSATDGINGSGTLALLAQGGGGGSFALGNVLPSS